MKGGRVPGYDRDCVPVNDSDIRVRWFRGSGLELSGQIICSQHVLHEVSAVVCHPNLIHNRY